MKEEGDIILKSRVSQLGCICAIKKTNPIMMKSKSRLVQLLELYGEKAGSDSLSSLSLVELGDKIKEATAGRCLCQVAMCSCFVNGIECQASICSCSISLDGKSSSCGNTFGLGGVYSTEEVHRKRAQVIKEVVKARAIIP